MKFFNLSWLVVVHSDNYFIRIYSMVDSIP